ncbi:L-threonine 3-dehydrogenase [Demequina aurantiaca]|uniref:L-threonine 3-dehydrogenase n=1 Tax=Demequina aurantiaca TaxID=676200 RepID=UPI0007801EFA|nr:L-threonine 3-dehydrogenase [Demequina aurantiaca]
MRALLKATSGPGLELADVPEPNAGDADVTIRVLRTGICGTDLHIESWDAWAASTLVPPIVPGHEFSGEVVAVGSAVRDVHVGAIVSGEGHIVCGTCRNCRAGRRQMCNRTSGLGVNRNGAFAEYVVLPESNVWVHPDGMNLDHAAVFDPLGNAVHTALKFPLVGEDVLISGAGPIGLMAAAVVRHIGARFVVVTDVSEPRLKLARIVGADLALNVSHYKIADAQEMLGMREGFDVGLEMSGHPTALPEMIENLTHGGRVAMLGLASEPINVDWAKVVTHMLTISGIYGREMFETWNAMSAMLQSSADLRVALDTVITHRLPVSEWEQGFAVARTASAGKVVLDWTEAPG